MTDLKEIKIFLASSIVEFEKDRFELESYMARLNREYRKRGIVFDLEICENASNALSMTRKQDEYNDIIRASRYVYLLIGEKIGQFTEEEFDVALEQFRSTGAPLIYTYFKRMPEGQSADGHVLDFMKRLSDNLGHYYTEYSDLDSVKLNIILELMRDPEVGGVVQFEDGRALLNGQEIMSLENVPIYGGNDDLQATKQKLDELNERFAELKLEFANNGDMDLFAQMKEVDDERATLSDSLRQMENAILENLNLIASKSRSSDSINWREMKAAQFVANGLYKEANLCLDDPMWDEEAKHAEEIALSAREQIREYVSGRQAYIANLKSMGVTGKSESKIVSAYDEATRLAIEFHMCFDLVYDYVEFLHAQRHYDEGIAVANRLAALYDAYEGTLEQKAKLQGLLARLHMEQRSHDEAERCYRKAIGLYQRSDDPRAKLLLANTYTALADELWRQKRQKEAEELLDKALAIQVERPDASHRNLGYTYNMLGIVARAKGNLEQSEQYQAKAIEHRTEAARDGDVKNLASLTISLNNMAFLFNYMKRYDEAEKLLLDVLATRERLAADNPSAFEGRLANTRISYARVLKRTDRFEEAERQLEGALAIRRRFAAIDRKATEKSLAIALEEYASLIRDAGWQERFDEANELYEEAFVVREKMALKNPNADELRLGINCLEHAKLLEVMGETEAAAEKYEMALEVIGRRFELEGASARENYAMICNDFGAFLAKQGSADRARALLEQSCAIWEELDAQNPGIFSFELAAAQQNLATVQ